MVFFFFLEGEGGGGGDLLVTMSLFGLQAWIFTSRCEIIIWMDISTVCQLGFVSLSRSLVFMICCLLCCTNWVMNRRLCLGNCCDLGCEFGRAICVYGLLCNPLALQVVCAF